MLYLQLMSVGILDTKGKATYLARKDEDCSSRVMIEVIILDYRV